MHKTQNLTEIILRDETSPQVPLKANLVRGSTVIACDAHYQTNKNKSEIPTYS